MFFLGGDAAFISRLTPGDTQSVDTTGCIDTCDRAAAENNEALLILFAPDSGVAVRHQDVELLGALQDQLALLGGDGVRHLGTVPLVLHHQHLQLLGARTENVTETGGYRRHKPRSAGLTTC